MKSFPGDLHTYVWRRLYANNLMVVIIILNSVEFGGSGGRGVRREYSCRDLEGS